MEIIKPSVEIISDMSEEAIREAMLKLEAAGRTCYKSEAKNPECDPEITDGFIGRIIGRQHTSVIEHHSITVKFICDRGVTHELVRHRLCSFSQESSRYCNYSKKGMQFIKPPWVSDKVLGEWNFLDMLALTQDEEGLPSPDFEWMCQMEKAEEAYNILIDDGWKPEQARSVLPNSLKTEIVVTANLRQWREVLRQRTAKAAHPQIREIMDTLLEYFVEKMPVIFGDLV